MQEPQGKVVAVSIEVTKATYERASHNDDGAQSSQPKLNEDQQNHQM